MARTIAVSCFRRLFKRLHARVVVTALLIIIIITYIYHALINTPSAHMTHINLNIIFCSHVEHGPTKTTHTKPHRERQTTPPPPHTHTRIKTTMNSNVYDTDLYHTPYIKLGIDISWGENTVRRGRFSVWL